MPLSTIPIDAITTTDLTRLKDNGVRESKRLDYKEALPGFTDSDKKEFLADIAAMANTAGGDVLYGVKELRDANGKPTGIAEKIVGVPVPNPDQLRLQLLQLIRDGIAPRIQGIEIHPVFFPEGQAVLIIRIPPSLQGPHMITYKRQSPFFTRGEAGKSPMDVDEIRQAFLRSASILERADMFRRTRVDGVLQENIPVPLAKDATKVLLHVIPLTTQPFAVDFSDGQVNAVVRELYPLPDSGGIATRLNFDGRVNFIPALRDGEPNESYVQVFRDGTVEFGDATLLRPIPFEGTVRKICPSPGLEQTVVDGVRRSLKVLHALTIPLPVIIFISLIDVYGYKLSRAFDHEGFYRNIGIDRRNVLPAGQIVDREDEKVEVVLKPIFDTIANTAGYLQSFAYDNDGNWLGK